MTRRWFVVLVVALVAAAAVTVGVATSKAEISATPLAQITPAQLLARVAGAAKTTSAVSGDVTWTNGLIPGSDLTSMLSGQSSAPTSLAGLALGGSGRIWIQKGNGMRLEAQGSGSDFVLVAGKGGLWSYSSATTTATHYAAPAGVGAAPSASPQAAAADPLAAITSSLQHFASTGTVSVSGQTTVAGEPGYLLTMTPKSATTTLGSVQVAVDGKTFVPLRVEVFAKGDATAVLSAGFTSVSFKPVSSDLFAFAPPSGATVKQQALPSLQGLSGGGGAQGAPAKATATADKSLTIAQADAAARRYGLTLVVPGQAALPSSLPFAGATVTAPTKTHGAVAVLHYGAGFGSIVLLEAQGTSGQAASLEQQIARLPHSLVTATTIAGGPGYELQTPLVSVAAWRHGSVAATATGLVPQALLAQFVAAIH
jgi:outer membrane lipoprotein-sorting protein